jgi:hypothetical protein
LAGGSSQITTTITTTIDVKTATIIILLAMKGILFVIALVDPLFSTDPINHLLSQNLNNLFSL